MKDIIIFVFAILLACTAKAQVFPYEDVTTRWAVPKGGDVLHLTLDRANVRLVIKYPDNKVRVHVMGPVFVEGGAAGAKTEQWRSIKGYGDLDLNIIFNWENNIAKVQNVKTGWKDMWFLFKKKP